MKDTFIILALAIVAVVIGGTLFLLGPKSLSGVWSNSSGSASAVPFKEITSGTHSAITERVNYLIASETELNQLWELLNTDMSPPTIDFSQNVVAAVFGGTHPTAGYEVEVSKVVDIESARKVNVSLKKPGVTCAAAQVETSPYQIIELSKSNLPLTHEDTVSTISCLN